MKYALILSLLTLFPGGLRQRPVRRKGGRPE
jgi:hypothetical protein